MRVVFIFLFIFVTTGAALSADCVIITTRGDRIEAEDCRWEGDRLYFHYDDKNYVFDRSNIVSIEGADAPSGEGVAPSNPAASKPYKATALFEIFHSMSKGQIDEYIGTIRGAVVFDKERLISIREAVPGDRIGGNYIVEVQCGDGEKAVVGAMMTDSQASLYAPGATVVFQGELLGWEDLDSWRVIYIINGRVY